jgi:hypothetical protein
MRPHGLHEALARLGQRDAAGAARQKSHAETRLKRTDCAAKGRLRHADLSGSAGEASFPRYGQQSD